MRAYHLESLSHDPIHGYVPFTAAPTHGDGDVCERQIIDNPWVQRLRQIHQLQTAWWVYPTAEHTRFQHVLGVMHLASRVVRAMYPSLSEVCSDVPSIGYVECLMRMAGLLHDVGHGPFGHFFDAHFLRRFDLTHETLGALIIQRELAPMLMRLRATPSHTLADGEQLDPGQVAWIIQRPRAGDASDQPRWLTLLRSLFSGIYTVDNMDFVLRDAYMSGYSQCAFDLQRLLHYSFFTTAGLTIHDRGMDALIRFMSARSELFRSIYFHRTVRAIDLTLADLFAECRADLFPGNPAEHLDVYCQLTEWTVWSRVQQWSESRDARQRALGRRWQQLFARQVPWKMIVQRTQVFAEGDSERASIFSAPRFVEEQLRSQLPAALSELDLRVDIARHIFRPHTDGPSSGQNFMYDSARGEVRPLSADVLFHRLPTAQRICRVYAHSDEHADAIAMELDGIIGGSLDDATNM